MRLLRAESCARSGRAWAAGRVLCRPGPESNTCPLIGVCKLSVLFRAGLKAFFAELDKVTLADMIADGPVLIERLMANQATQQAMQSAGHD